MALACGVADRARSGDWGGGAKMFFQSKLLTLMSYKQNKHTHGRGPWPSALFYIIIENFFSHFKHLI